MEPASVRYNNPGAMWGGNALAKKWGATDNIKLNDGLGQGNTIAVFPDKVHGAAAQFDLWHTSANYKNKPLVTAIKTWSGGNSYKDYVNFLIKRVKGLTPSTIIDEAFLLSPSGIDFVKAQAWNEAGKPYPMTDDEWKQAQALVFSGSVKAPVPTNATPELTPTINIGDSGENVLRLQKALSCIPTGTYSNNSETEFALKLFQVRHKLEPDGICGQLTWEKLNSKTEW